MKKIKKAKVKAPLTVKQKRNGKEVDERLYANMPHGFSVIDGTMTQPLGTVIASNNKSIFEKKENGKPARKKIIVLKDKEVMQNKQEKKQQNTAETKKADKPVAQASTPKAVVPKPTVTKVSKKAIGKSTSASTNSVKAADTAKQSAVKPTAPKKADATPEKRRVYKSLPKGYSVVQGTVAQSDGTILIHNGKPLFKQNKDGIKQQAKDSRGKPAHKVAALIVDPNAFNQAKSAERKLVDVEIRKHHDAKGGHPHIMVDTIGDKNVSVGTTHDKKKGKNHPNIPLEVNPLGGKEQAFMQRQGTVDSKENYSKTKRQGKLTETDFAKAKQIGEKAKQKELNKQTSKK